MAQNDYVARGRGKKSPPPPPKPTLPWPGIVIALIVLAAFGYFLWWLKGAAPESPEAETKPVVKQQDTLPDMPKEEWEFITSLPEYTVEVDVQEQEKSSVRYLMQCGSFKQDSQAQELKAKIAFQGLEAQVRRSKGSAWSRVILGPYETKRHAEADRHQLQKTKINGCVIWNWNL